MQQRGRPYLLTHVEHSHWMLLLLLGLLIGPGLLHYTQ
jgi:hypothetical protein